MQVFSNQYNATETWSAQGATVEWGTLSNANPTSSVPTGDKFPLLMQNVQMTFSRRAQDVAGINTDKSGLRKRIRIYDAPVGELRITSIFSPYANQLKDFFEAVAKDCKSQSDQVWMTLSPFGRLSCSQGSNNAASNVPASAFGTFTLYDVDLETLALTIQAGQNGNGAVSTMPLIMSFTDLHWDV